MKRCPECRRDYTNETLNFCLDDGAGLLDGPGSIDEPATAILSGPISAASGFDPSTSGAESNTTIFLPQTTASDSVAVARPGRFADKRLFAAPILLAII